MNISIVIPVYNEGEHLAACLSAIAAQTVSPYEVIVVDNNSTDNTRLIAQQFDFVTLISERRQGVVFARGRGFDAARGDIIGRIDADTIVDPTWVAALTTLFADPTLDATSGATTYYDLPWQRLVGRLDLVFRQWIANGMGQDVFLFGSNMAIRRTAWQQVRKSICLKAGVHEDFDLAIHLRGLNARTTFDDRLVAAVSLRRLNVSFKDYLHYVWLSPQTYRAHGSHAQTRMYPVVALVLPFYPVIQLFYRCYDPATDRLSLERLFVARPPLRVNPATFVD